MIVRLDIILGDSVRDVRHEVEMAMTNWPEWNSAHEGFAILLEEVDELKSHVWKKQSDRDIPAMRKEAIQVAAMALRFVVEICNEHKGRR